jgi:hypothetical protein
MATLVSLAEAKRQLRIENDDQDTGVMEIAAGASAIVLDYLKTPDADYDDETVPLVIKRAVLAQMTVLQEDRSAGIADQVKDLLSLWRDPALA